MIGPVEKLGRVLDRMGGIYTVDDLLERIADGRMQSFATNSSWMVTQVVAYPRARQLQVVAMVGDIADADHMNDELTGYADRNNIALISAVGRRGWMQDGRERGWRVKARSFLYQREM
jgi:hypothetical protein